MIPPSKIKNSKIIRKTGKTANFDALISFLN